MGRPLGKKYFKTGPGNQLKVRAKIGANAEGDGFIVSQKSSRRYKVTVGGNTAVCNLVDKANGTLLANEVSIAVLTDANVVKHVTKLTSRQAVVDGAKVKWNFDTNLADGAVMAADADAAAVAPVVITISVDPINASVTAPAPASFSVTAGIAAGYTLKYRWQLDSGAGFANITNGGVYAGATSATLAINNSTGLTGMLYRCVVSATGVTSVNSAAATLTVA